MSIVINLFHIFIVASLICSLAKNLAPGNDNLKNTAYVFVTIMTLFHSYRIYQKTTAL
jgi:hypothetical protein